jgi:alcohol dehydrogenase class IV
MQSPNVNPHLLINTAIEALKHACEECSGSSTGEKITIAIKAIVQLQHELENATKQCRHNAGVGKVHHICGY